MSEHSNLISLGDIQQLVGNEQTFVLNIIAAWCSDCTERQAPLFNAFTELLAEQGITVYQLLAQQQKNQFIDDEIAAFVDSVGGHGFPRTVYFSRGLSTALNEIELITSDLLHDYSDKIVSVHEKTN
ncbi:hypothetical protein SIN8267_00388 [Sinobacterium norvegicum]|uniref:Thioredoxin n=1 Tax=Sinobacterium norvegicum TaxID=1641715 RepID=A0ABM9ABN5_9GAMM|nr:hypothetical protein [Sinobacterium norvegicum]CAH0990296.1 hypothetical protein SIN8267_00388 [Sinobacterium norvegicum]